MNMLWLHDVKSDFMIIILFCYRFPLSNKCQKETEGKKKSEFCVISVVKDIFATEKCVKLWKHIIEIP